MLRGVLKRNNPLAGEVALFRCRLSRRDFSSTHSIELLHVVKDESAGLGRSKKTILEISGKLRFFLIQVAQLCLVGFGEICAGTNKVPVVILDERLLRRIEPKRIATIVDALHALIQLVV